MSRLTTADIIALGTYLDPSFEPSSLTVAQLTGVLSHHSIRIPGSMTKPKLVELFDKEIKANSGRLRSQRMARQKIKASDRGIYDGVSGLPISSSTGTASLDEEEEGEVKVPRRTSRRLSKVPVLAIDDDDNEGEEGFDPITKPKRRRSSATPALGRSSGTRKSVAPPPVMEVSDEEDDEMEREEPSRKVSRGKNDSAGPSARRISQKIEKEKDVGGWEDNNVFQSSSPVRSPKMRSPRKSLSTPRKSRVAHSAPPEMLSSPQRSPLPRSTFEPSLPLDMTPFKPGKKDAAIAEEQQEDEHEHEQQDEISESHAPGQVVPRRTESSPTRPRGERWRQVLMGILFLALSGLIAQFKSESAQIGYCDTGSNTNWALIEVQRKQREVEECKGDDCPLHIPLLVPNVCTPCPEHATCGRTTVTCRDGFILRTHPLSLLSTVADGLPGLGPVAYPPKCVEDPNRKKNIGTLGKGIDAVLATERGKRVCNGITPAKEVDGGEARKWGFEVSRLKEEMSKIAPAKVVENLDVLFSEAVQQLEAYGRLIRGYDSEGKMYLATEHVEMNWTCRMTVAIREAWLEWQKSVFGTLALVLSGLYVRSQVRHKRIESKRVSELVQIALDALRNQEMMHHTDPVLNPQGYVPSLQLRDRVLAQEHSVGERKRLWNKVEAVVESNANVRVNEVEVQGGDEMRVWQWVGLDTI